MNASADSLNRWSLANAPAVASLGIRETERNPFGVNLVALERATQLVTAYPGKVTMAETSPPRSMRLVTQFSPASVTATTLTV